jgi:hypothetical protein
MTPNSDEVQKLNFPFYVSIMTMDFIAEPGKPLK